MHPNNDGRWNKQPRSCAFPTSRSGIRQHLQGILSPPVGVQGDARKHLGTWVFDLAGYFRSIDAEIACETGNQGGKYGLDCNTAESYSLPCGKIGQGSMGTNAITEPSKIRQRL